jgi:hypothetical protein
MNSLVGPRRGPIDRRAGCGKSASPVRREGRPPRGGLSYPYRSARQPHRFKKFPCNKPHRKYPPPKNIFIFMFFPLQAQQVKVIVRKIIARVRRIHISEHTAVAAVARSTGVINSAILYRTRITQSSYRP